MTGKQHLTMRELIRSSPVSLNQMVDIKIGFNYNARNLRGRFIKDLGKFLLFESINGVRECIYKWDILHGDYDVTYIWS